MIAKSAFTSLALSALFLFVYGGTNYLTSLRANVPTCHFAWERHIPFVPWMIVPYMSIDLFFIAAPFLCRDNRERRVLAARIAAAILIAGACFLLFPMRFGFDRPHVDGVLGVIFNNFRTLDHPFNLFPSLHIALQIILLTTYLAHTRGLLGLTVCFWFVLIGVSTVLTFQHHVIDLIGGAVLGALCLHLFQPKPLREPVTPNIRIGLFYAAGAILVIAIAYALQPGGLLLLWPAMAIAVVASAYFGVGPGVFRKRGGRVPWLTKLLLWPVLLGQRASLAYYAKQSDGWNALTDRVWIGRKLSHDEARRAIEQGVVAVLDLAGEFTEASPFHEVAYRQLSVMDLTAPTEAQLADAIAFIDDQSGCGVVYVHCKAGYSRTAAVAGAYLLSSGRASSVEQAVELLKAARPAIVIRPEIRRMLECFKPTTAPASLDARAVGVVPSRGSPAP